MDFAARALKKMVTSVTPQKEVYVCFDLTYYRAMNRDLRKNVKLVTGPKTCLTKQANQCNFLHNNTTTSHCITKRVVFVSETTS